ncbi:MAG TPA: DUF3566 domain-containing protein [Streptosporangiaceae bacterium]|nr:DUF3566 domain-containing protein [Streptosporangiaceae bacterium]
MDQRAEPPSWLPEGAVPRTATGADLRRPEADEADQGTSVGETEYSFTGETSYPNGQDTTFGQGGSAVGGYSYGGNSLGDATAQVPPYPAKLPDPAEGSGSAAADGRTAGGTDESRGRTTTFSAPPRGRYVAGAASMAGAGPLAGAGSAARAPASQVQARRADLVVARLEPWSVMKFSFLMSLVAWVMLFVAVAFLYFVLSNLGVFTSVQHTLGSVTSSSSSSGMHLSQWFSASRVLGYTMLLGAVNIILITALSTVGAMIYNLVTHLGGGIEVTLRETD